jgi:thioredoxin-related protein
MQKVAYLALLFVTLGLSMASSRAPIADPPAEEIAWYSWEEAIEIADATPKKIFVDLYTDWCGWCKRMDATTFKDPAVVKYMNEHFIAIKFNAEQKENVGYRGYEMKFNPSIGRRGAHELAISLLEGRLSYPSYVYLDEEQRRITISPGYKEADALLRELKFIAGEHYRTMQFKDFAGEE